MEKDFQKVSRSRPVQCEVEFCERAADYRAQHTAFYVGKPGSPSDKGFTYFCRMHADDAVYICKAIGMDFGIVELP